jgi:hypothetical protein
LPRKYHRPPTAKRRKSKKTSSPNVLEPLPESQTDISEEAFDGEVDEEFEEGDDIAEYVDEGEDDYEYEAAPVEQKARPARHLVADYGYVLSEMKVSLALALFLVVALAITAILR